MLRVFERVGRRGQRRYERSDSLDAKGRHAPDPASVPSVAIWHAPPPPPPSPRPALTSGTSFLIYTLLILTGPNGGQPPSFCIWAVKHCLRSLKGLTEEQKLQPFFLLKADNFIYCMCTHSQATKWAEGGGVKLYP